MLYDLMFSVSIILPMVILVFIGLQLRRVGIFSKHFLVGANKLVFYIAIPSLLFISVSTSNLSQIFDPFFAIFLLAGTTVAFLLLWLFTYLILRKRAPDVISAFVQGSFRGNIVIVAIPILFSILGEEGQALGGLSIAVLIPLFNFLSIILLVTHSEKGGKISVKSLIIGIVKNPPIIATASAILVYILNIQLPGFLISTLSYTSSIATPLALMCLGGGLSFQGFDKKFKYSFISAFIKVVGIPVMFTIAAFLVGFRGESLITIAIVQGVPTAVAGHVMIVEIGGDTYVSGTNILISTVMSAFTMTLAIFTLRTLGIVAV